MHPFRIEYRPAPRSDDGANSGRYAVPLSPEIESGATKWCGVPASQLTGIEVPCVAKWTVVFTHSTLDALTACNEIPVIAVCRFRIWRGNDIRSHAHFFAFSCATLSPSSFLSAPSMARGIPLVKRREGGTIGNTNTRPA